VTEQIVGEQAKAGDYPSCSKANSVTQTLVSVAENLMKLPSNGAVQGQSVTVSAEQQMATESSDVAVSTCSKLDGVVLSMPDLSEFAPVVDKGVVQPADAMLNSMYEDDPMDEGHATDSPLVDTFDKLLHVENVPDNMLKEIHEPLLEILAPTISPVLGDSEIEDSVELAREINYSSSSVSPEKTTNVLAHVKSHQAQKRDPKSYGNRRNSNLTKENDSSEKNAVKVASVCKKVDRESKRTAHVSRREKQEAAKRPKKLSEIQQTLKEVAQGEIKDKRISDFKIPLRHRTDNFIRPGSRYRHEEPYPGRCVGLGRGVRPNYLSRHDEGLRLRPPSYNRAGYIPNLTPDQQAWLNQMPHGWYDR